MVIGLMNLQTGFTIFINHVIIGKALRICKIFLGKLGNFHWEDIRQLSYKYYNEDDYKKGAYSICSEEKNFSGTKEKDPFLVYDDERKQGLTVHKAHSVKYYVSVDIYLNRENKFLKYLANAKYVKHEVHTVFPNKYPKDEKYVYEVLGHNVTTKDDFILTTFKPNLQDKYIYFDFQNEKYYWDNSTWSEQLKNNFFSEKIKTRF